MFSFFRKKDLDGNDTQSGPVTLASRPDGPVTTSPATIAPATIQPEPAAAPQDHQQYDLSKLTIEVGSGSETLSPVEEQTAMLHANGQLAAAIQILAAEKAHFAGKIESWLMLFELYQQQQDHQAFDALALEYVVVF